MNTAITPESAALIQRVQEARKQCGVSIASIANAAGMYRPTVTNQLNGKFNLDIRVVLAVASLCPQISAEWLLRGTGDKNTSNPSALEQRVARIERLLNSK